MNTETIVEVVAREYGCSPAQIRGRSRKHPLPEARMMISYLLKSLPLKSIGSTINRDHSTVLRGIRLMTAFKDTYENTHQHYQNILKKLELPHDMTIKMSRDQLRAVATLIEYYLTNHAPQTDADGLIRDHMDDINEKIRKRIRGNNVNLSLDPKQVKAFNIWYQNLAKLPSEDYQFERNTLLIMINQIKP